MVLKRCANRSDEQRGVSDEEANRSHDDLFSCSGGPSRAEPMERRSLSRGTYPPHSVLLLLVLLVGRFSNGEVSQQAANLFVCR